MVYRTSVGRRSSLSTAAEVDMILADVEGVCNLLEESRNKLGGASIKCE